MIDVIYITLQQANAKKITKYILNIIMDNKLKFLVLGLQIIGINTDWWL